LTQKHAFNLTDNSASIMSKILCTIHQILASKKASIVTVLVL